MDTKIKFKNTATPKDWNELLENNSVSEFGDTELNAFRVLYKQHPSWWEQTWLVHLQLTIKSDLTY